MGGTYHRCIHLTRSWKGSILGKMCKAVFGRSGWDRCSISDLEGCSPYGMYIQSPGGQGNVELQRWRLDVETKADGKD